MRRIGLALLAIAALSGGVQAQSYPTRPVTMVVPFPPGGNTDLMARALQAELSKALGQSIIINNKGGAAGTIGILELVKAEPDGYTIGLSPNTPLTAQTHLIPLSYSLSSFRFLCSGANFRFCLAVVLYERNFTWTHKRTSTALDTIL